MRPPESFSTFSIHGLCMVSHTLDCGAMKVWNFSVTALLGQAARGCGAPSAAAAVALSEGAAFDHGFSTVDEDDMER